VQDCVSNPSSVKKLATRYVREILGAQDHHSYCIAGICSGAVLAYEVAQLLIARNRDVELLAMIEPSELSSRSPGNYLNMSREILWRLIDKMRSPNGHLPVTGKAETLAQFKLLKKLLLNVVAITHHKPKPYDRSLHLFLTKGSLSEEHTGMREWVKMAKRGAFVHEIPGTHRSITGDKATINEEEMKVLAGKISAVIGEGHPHASSPAPPS
jgi:thioesterase domain-containing protein